MGWTDRLVAWQQGPPLKKNMNHQDITMTESAARTTTTSRMATLLNIFVLSWFLPSSILAFSESKKIPRAWSRRSFVLSTTLIVGLPTPPSNALIPTEPRSVDVGGGFDLLSSNSDKLQYRDVLYPPSMEGLWVCDRIVTQVDGDTFQAKKDGKLWVVVISRI
eukprot:scaffold13947_cov73-Cylindrotheca_fusiformis.AAC.1